MWQESRTEGQWHNEQQLLDVLKSETAKANFMVFCKKNGLVKYDRRQKCHVYYHTKKLETYGTRKEGVMEKSGVAQAGDKAKALANGGDEEEDLAYDEEGEEEEYDEDYAEDE
eukprot:8207829-Pyramimonas_sp.AAC.1